MATVRGPKFKLCRRLGVNVYGHPKAMNRVSKGSRKKLSEYGLQLLEKQKLKAYYGVLEKQFVRYVDKAKNSKDLTGSYLIKTLECRLDNIVYRIGFSNSIRLARQLVSHGHILVNGKKVNIPSYQIKANDVVSLKEASRRNELFLNNFLQLQSFKVPYIEKNLEEFSGKLIRLPERDEVPIEVNEILVVEFYSR